MKHVGKMKNNSARIAIVYRTLPGDPNSALVVGTAGLRDMYHDNLMSVIEHESGQQANELAEVLAVRKFADGSNMLEYLHVNGHLKKVPTTLVLVTPDSKTSIPLDELNKLIADQKGITLDELAIGGGEVVKTKPTPPADYAEKPVEESPHTSVVETSVPVVDDVTAKDLRSMADKLFKEAQALRKKADEIDPPKKKSTKAEKAEA